MDYFGRFAGVGWSEAPLVAERGDFDFLLPVLTPKAVPLPYPLPVLLVAIVTLGDVGVFRVGLATLCVVASRTLACATTVVAFACTTPPVAPSFPFPFPLLLLLPRFPVVRGEAALRD